MPQIRVVALAGALMLAGFAFACRDELMTLVEPNAPVAHAIVVAPPTIVHERHVDRAPAAKVAIRRPASDRAQVLPSVRAPGRTAHAAHVSANSATNTATLPRSVKENKSVGVTQSAVLVPVDYAPPSVAVGPSNTITSGDQYWLTGWFSDPRVNDRPWTYVVNWGTATPTTDSTSTPGAISTGQRYLAAGTYTITLNVTDRYNRTGGSASTTVTVLRLSVGLDIEPGDTTNAITLSDSSMRAVPVAVLSSPSFDPRLVDVRTVRIGGASVASKDEGRDAVSLQDVNGDGKPDLVLRFMLADLVSAAGLDANSTSLTLLATLTDGRQIRASDVVRLK